MHNIVLYINIYIYINVEIIKANVFRKVLNKQFIKRLKAIFITNKTQLLIPTDCFTPLRDHQVSHLGGIIGSSPNTIKH